MLRGWLAADVAPATFHIIDPVAENLPEGVHVHRSSAALDTGFDVVILGIKPQLLAELAPEIKRILIPGATLVSILAGTTTDKLSAYFPDARVIRLMPNLAAAIGKSPLGVFAPHDDAQQRAEMGSLLAPLGAVIWIDDEAHMDAVTALAGSGPAFVYRFIDALTHGGEA
jgi:pyrroline-5-carboxylate reductase